MRCKKCGVENTEDTEFCRNCGYELNESLSKDLTKKDVLKSFKKIYITFLAAITCLIVSFFVPSIYSYIFHTPLDPVLGIFNLILIILGSGFTIYFYIQFYRTKDELMSQNEVYYSQLKKIAYLLLLLLISMLLNYVTGY